MNAEVKYIFKPKTSDTATVIVLIKIARFSFKINEIDNQIVCKQLRSIIVIVNKLIYIFCFVIFS